MTEDEYLIGIERATEDFHAGEHTAAEFCSILKHEYGFDDSELIEVLIAEMVEEDVVSALIEKIDSGT